MSNIKKKKRKLNGKFVALVAGTLLIILSIIKIPNFINTNRLLELGYSQEAISAINAKHLRSTILKNKYYSDYLNDEVIKDSFNKEYLRLYLITDELNDDYFNLYEKLKTKRNYNDEELEYLYSKLRIYDLKPLIVFDKLDNLDDYINDCLANENDNNHFNISGDYFHPYENYIEIEDPSLIDVYVSPKSSIGNYAPSKLAEIVKQYAIPNVLLESRALDAYYSMCKAIASDNVKGFYAVNAYIPYESQKELYINDPYKNLKEGFSDNQTGLCVSLTIEGESFKDSNTYKWLLEHAHEYGFIQRYPEGKEALTNHLASYTLWRFVGIELASNIYDSGMCFDEYYYNYLY